MRAWPLILISILLGYVIYYFLFIYPIEIKVDKYLKFEDCEVKYKYSYSNFATKYNWNDRISFENYLNEESAKNKLIRCLCDKYLIDSSNSIKNFIENFFDENEQAQFNYYTSVSLDTSVLMSHCKGIFKEDERWYKAINKYLDKDSLLLVNILVDRFHQNNSVQNEYFEYIKFKTSHNPGIGTLVRYKEKIFK